MSNTYYKYSKNITKSIVSELTLTAYENEHERQNNIQLNIVMRGSDDKPEVGIITLTEQEQDDLIAGILERRGFRQYKEPFAIDAHNIGEKNCLMLFSKIIDATGISATGNEQSKIHPADKE